MPMTLESYKNGKIYKIWSLDTDKIYIGSSCDFLSNRMCGHKISYTKWKHGIGNKISSATLFDLVGIENCKIDIIHAFPCKSKNELTAEEGRLQRLHRDIIVNKKIEGRTRKEFYKDNKQKISDERKIKHACECGGKFSIEHKARHINTKKHNSFLHN